ncbi:MAG: TldD/PmbA family protein [bacterium]
MSLPTKDIQFIADLVLLRAKERCQYVDFRFEEIESEGLSSDSGTLAPVEKSTSIGYAVRVLKDGAWGFAASCVMDLGEYERIVDTAIAIAEASKLVAQAPAQLAPVDSYREKYQTPFQIDPFALGLAEKQDLLRAWQELFAKYPDLNSTSGWLDFRKTSKYFKSSEGSEIEQVLLHCGAGITCGIVKGRRERYERSFPSSSGQYVSGGYESISTFGIEDNIARLASEAVAMQTAKPCPEGEMTIILSPDMASLQVHESIGHPLELDRVFGAERNFSGTSFATPDRLGSLKYASEIVNVYSDPSYPGGLSTYGFDDEGVKAERRPLIEKGTLAGYLSSRETAQRLGQLSSGAARADGWSNVPICRMTNLILEPGNQSFAQMLAEVENGIYLETVASWSIDDNRENFQMGTEIGWEIKNGKLGEMIIAPSYSGSTVSFWRNCSSVGSRDEWVLWGTPNCGKGQPGQNARTAQGTAYLRFDKVKVG